MNTDYRQVENVEITHKEELMNSVKKAFSLTEDEERALNKTLQNIPSFVKKNLKKCVPNNGSKNFEVEAKSISTEKMYGLNIEDIENGDICTNAFDELNEKLKAQNDDCMELKAKFASYKKTIQMQKQFKTITNKPEEEYYEIMQIVSRIQSRYEWTRAESANKFQSHTPIMGKLYSVEEIVENLDNPENEELKTILNESPTLKAYIFKLGARLKELNEEREELRGKIFEKTTEVRPIIDECIALHDSFKIYQLQLDFEKMKEELLKLFDNCTTFTDNANSQYEQFLIKFCENGNRETLACDVDKYIEDFKITLNDSSDKLEKMHAILNELEEKILVEVEVATKQKNQTKTKFVANNKENEKILNRIKSELESLDKKFTKARRGYNATNVELKNKVAIMPTDTETSR